MATIDNIADNKYEKNIVFKSKLVSFIKSRAEITFVDFSVHKLNTKINPLENNAAHNKYNVCILCIIRNKRTAKVKLSFFKKKHCS